MLKKICFVFITLILLTSCSNYQTHQIKISATTWIGYSPLFYAKAKGWLKPLNIKLMNVSSLSENMILYKAGKSDAYVGTQYEFHHLNDKDLIPILMFDRSNGGDVIMSNRSLEELQTTSQEIDAYLEIDSVNSMLLESFLEAYQLKDKKINYINQDQTQIAVLKSNDIKKASVLITYIPYNVQLEKNGFHEVASTKQNLDLLVVDAMFTSKEVLSQHKEQFIKLKQLIDTAIENLKRDPREYYETIKPNLLDMSYEDFLHSFDDIVWINKNLEQEIKCNLEDSNFPLRSLL